MAISRLFSSAILVRSLSERRIAVPFFSAIFNRAHRQRSHRLVRLGGRRLLRRGPPQAVLRPAAEENVSASPSIPSSVNDFNGCCPPAGSGCEYHVMTPSKCRNHTARTCHIPIRIPERKCFKNEESRSPVYRGAGSCWRSGSRRSSGFRRLLRRRSLLRRRGLFGRRVGRPLQSRPALLRESCRPDVGGRVLGTATTVRVGPALKRRPFLVRRCCRRPFGALSVVDRLQPRLYPVELGRVDDVVILLGQVPLLIDATTRCAPPCTGVCGRSPRVVPGLPFSCSCSFSKKVTKPFGS